MNKCKRHHNGIDFTMYETPSRGECATQNGKYHLDGTSSITIADGQYKYGDEVIIQVYNKPGSFIRKARVNHNYDRVQIFFNKKEFLEMAKEISKDFHD